MPLWEKSALHEPEARHALASEEAGEVHVMLEDSQVIGRIVLEMHHKGQKSSAL